MLIYGKTPKEYIKPILDFWPLTIVVPILIILILLGAGGVLASEKNIQPYGQQPTIMQGMDYDGVNPGNDKNRCLKYEDCPVWDGDPDTKIYYDLMKLPNGKGIIAKSDFNWQVHLYTCQQNELLDSINGKGTFEILAMASAEDGMIPCPVGITPHWGYDWESHILRANLKRLTMLWQKDFQTGRYQQDSIDKVE